MTLLAALEPAPPTRVVIVGGGAAAAIAVTHLFRAADASHPLDVHLVERDRSMGPGLAYRTQHPRHTVNNFAERLSAVHGDPGHLIRWCAARGLELGARSFPTRKVYGEYLRSVLDDAEVPAESCLQRSRGLATALEQRDDRSWRVSLADGRTLPADRVVLALGNPPPKQQPHLEGLGERYVADPWDVALPARVEGARRVLLLGTGLTMVDLALQLAELAPRVELVAASRTGELPTAHVVEPTDGSDWRDAVDGVRPFLNDLWRILAAEDQERFATTYARAWATHRHRMSPATSHHLHQLLRAGTLVVRRVAEVAPADFDLVVNCTGPRPVASRGWNPLVDSMLSRGQARSHRLGLGVDLVQPGHPVTEEGEVLRDLFWMGAGRKGLEWEVGAVPDLREQAVLLARTVRDAAAAGATGPAAGTRSVLTRSGT